MAYPHAPYYTVTVNEDEESDSRTGVCVYTSDSSSGSSTADGRRRCKCYDLIKCHTSAIYTSEWTLEEINLLNETEVFAEASGRTHDNLSHHLLQRHRWLRFFTNVTSAILGVGGCTAFVAALAMMGRIDYAALIFGIISLFAGGANSLADSFHWQPRSRDHGKASDRYSRIAQEVRWLRNLPYLKRRYCELSMTRLSDVIAQAKADAPWIPDPDLQEIVVD